MTFVFMCCVRILLLTYLSSRFVWRILVQPLIRWVLQYIVNKCVLSSTEAVLLTLGSLKLSGNEFQASGPATEKARRPYRCRPGVVDWRI